MMGWEILNKFCMWNTWKRCAMQWSSLYQSTEQHPILWRHILSDDTADRVLIVRCQHLLNDNSSHHACRRSRGCHGGCRNGRLQIRVAWPSYITRRRPWKTVNRTTCRVFTSWSCLHADPARVQYHQHKSQQIVGMTGHRFDRVWLLCKNLSHLFFCTSK